MSDELKEIEAELSSVCPSCHGSGVVSLETCHDCGGWGTKQAYLNLKDWFKPCFEGHWNRPQNK